mgnify:CR=1 FL=1
MRVQINNEFRDYSEALFFGLNMRQLIFSALACGAAVDSYFLLKEHFSLETLSWLCILIASPFAALGFVKYNGMNAEQIVWAWIKCDILMPYELKFRSEPEAKDLALALEMFTEGSLNTFAQNTNVDAGHRLLKIGSSLVPFENKFPHNSLYGLMSTKFGET